MLETGIFTDAQKITRVTPVYKNGGGHFIQNYRPVPVLPVISKIFESVINGGLVKLFSKYYIINKSQYGFWKDR